MKKQVSKNKQRWGSASGNGQIVTIESTVSNIKDINYRRNIKNCLKSLESLQKATILRREVGTLKKNKLPTAYKPQSVPHFLKVRNLVLLALVQGQNSGQLQLLYSMCDGRNNKTSGEGSPKFCANRYTYVN